MHIVHILSVAIHTVSTTHRDAIIIIQRLAFLGPIVLSFALGSPLIGFGASRLRKIADRINSRMQSLGLNETELSDQCSLIAAHIFEDASAPALTRDRISKILMNRQDAPAKSAARVITFPEFAVLADVLKVSVEWLMVQERNQDPVVWNVLAKPGRVSTFTNLLQEYEELAKETIVWSQYPMHSYRSEAFSHAFNHVHFGQKVGIGDTRPLIEFANSVDRVRRKWLLRLNRSFEYTSLIYQSDLEHAICGQGVSSAISKTILIRNLDVMIDVISNPLLKLNLLILKDEDLSLRGSALENYEILGSVGNLFSVWNYHNSEVGWSEHPDYVKRRWQLLESMKKQSLFDNVSETVAHLKSLRCRLTQR
jgi:hypothetical protein